MLLARTAVILSAASCLFAGCADPNIQPVPFSLGHEGGAVALGPNLRTISVREREVLGRGPLPTVCSEPSPDVAIAFGRALAASASAKIGENSGSSSFQASATEEAKALEGRTAGVLALRDGLAAACQQYANGTIGQSAYAMILSQYGNLLVALAGTGTAGSAAPRFTAQETAVSALLVSCISEHDPTRLGALAENRRDPLAAIPLPNPLLTEGRCKALLEGIMRSSLLKPVKTSSAERPKEKTVAASAVTVNVQGGK